MRRGEITQNTWVTIILVVVGFIILFPFAANAAKYMVNYAEGGVCQATAKAASIRLDSRATFCKDVINSQFTMHCPRRHITIGETSSEVIEAGQTRALPVYSEENNRYYEQYTQLTGLLADSIVADELVSCWRKFGEGEIALFDNAGVDRNVFSDTRDVTACHVCAQITLDVEVEDSNLARFLREHNVPGEEYRFIEYLNNEEALCESHIRAKGYCWEEMEKYYTMPLDEMKAYFGQESFLGINDINDVQLKNYKDGRAMKMGPLLVDETYAVVYVRKRFDTCQGNLQELEDPELSNFVYVVPASDIDTLCNVVVT